MKKFTSFMSGCLVVIASVLTLSVYAETADNSQIYQLLDRSGTTRAIEGLPIQMQALGQQLALTAKNPQEHQEFMTLFIDSLDTDRMLQQMLENIGNNMSSEDIEGVLQWLHTDIGERIVNAELKSTEPEFQQNFMLFMAELQSSPPSDERKVAIMEFVEASGMVDQGMNLITGMVKNMFSVIKTKNSEDEELTKNLDDQLALMTKSMRPAFEQQMVLSSYYLYQDISNEDLATYMTFFEQPAGEKYLATMYDALGEALNTWGREMISQVVAQHDKTAENAE
ncbi:DUF2059 domain-containing protein [Thalassotalea eurytherma]|uniref:DUF2059 domain-containing protein n=1 Tax=Thalassotalea eurytherma TaxID=1144278 RepID=A0ABQ6H3W6_9GAMM|nr:hypothetical protein [Thalassotalea eurytherma]GLX82860.1 hypothetical protein theurythT_23120 [Thalassotalea eurytherma]